MNWASPAPYLIGIMLAGVGFLLIRGIVREIREASAKDEKEKTTKYIKGKMLEYGILIVVGIVAFVAVSYLKAGPLRGLSERLYGSTTSFESPFHGGK